MAGQAGFFGMDERLRALPAAGGPLERLASVVNFELFRAELEAAPRRSDRSRGGRPPYDAVVMFRVLVLQALHTLSDEQAEYRLRDRLSFMRFAGLAPHEPVPDATTIWLFRERLVRAGAIEKLFARFDAVLREQGLLAMGGQILDATIIQARPARLTAEKAVVRRGKVPEGWSPARTARVDRDARWTLRRGRKRSPAGGGSGSKRQAVAIVVPVFGYKNHVGIDRAHGLIRTWSVTHAAAHDGGRPGALLDPATTASGVRGDTAYRSAADLGLLARRGRAGHPQREKPRGKPMPRHVARGNATRGKVRAAVEHVFAAQKRRLGLLVRTVGLARARAKIALANLAYNLTRLAWPEARTLPA
jgi:IS5 family transposase